jgi:signal transduction histidine kinase
LVLVSILGVFDYFTGPEISLSVFYLVPTCLAAWSVGFRAGVALAFASAAVWLLADRLWNVSASSAWIPYWNVSARFAFFLLAVALICKAKQLNRALKNKAESLAAQIDERVRAEAALAESERVFRFISDNEKEILELIARGKPVGEVLRALISKLEAWSGGLFCSILVHDLEHRPALHAASSRITLDGPAKPDPPGSGSLQESELCIGRSKRGLPQNCATVETEWLRFRENALKAGLQVVYSEPVLSTGGETLGFLSIYSNRGLAGPEPSRFFEKIAHITVIALERQRSEDTLRRLSSLILNAQEAERRRLARELHDGVSQILSSVAFRIESVQSQIAPECPSLRQEVNKAKILLKKGILEVRRISENLRPSELDELGLLAAVRDLCQDFKERNQVSMQICLPTLPNRLGNDIELALYRITQETLRNIEKHADASEVAVTLSWEPSAIILRIRDNGRGLAGTAAAPGSKFGMGLVDMRERCAFLGGALNVWSERHVGTEITACIPVTATSR